MSWSDDDWGKPIFPTRFGSPQGHATERKMLDAVGGFDGVRMKIRTNPDGSVTTLKTRGGMPVFTSKHPQPTIFDAPAPYCPAMLSGLSDRGWRVVQSSTTVNIAGIEGFYPSANYAATSAGSVRAWGNPAYSTVASVPLRTQSYGVPVTGIPPTPPPPWTEYDATAGMTQLAFVKPGFYTGIMRRVVQKMLGARVQVKFNYTFAQSHGIYLGVNSGRPAPWVIEISAAGVFAARLNYCNYVASTVDHVPFTPTGCALPESDVTRLEAKILSGEIRRLASASDMAGIYEKSAFFPECGWAFSYNGVEAQNTCWSWPDAYKRSHRYKVAISTGADGPVSASVSIVDEGYMIGDLPAVPTGQIQFPNYYFGAGMSFDMRPEGLYNLPFDSVCPLYVYYDKDNSERLVKWTNTVPVPQIESKYPPLSEFDDDDISLYGTEYLSAEGSKGFTGYFSQLDSPLLQKVKTTIGRTYSTYTIFAVANQPTFMFAPVSGTGPMEFHFMTAGWIRNRTVQSESEVSKNTVVIPLYDREAVYHYRWSGKTANADYASTSTVTIRFNTYGRWKYQVSPKVIDGPNWYLQPTYDPTQPSAGNLTVSISSSHEATDSSFMGTEFPFSSRLSYDAMSGTPENSTNVNSPQPANTAELSTGGSGMSKLPLDIDPVLVEFPDNRWTAVSAPPGYSTSVHSVRSSGGQPGTEIYVLSKDTSATHFSDHVTNLTNLGYAEPVAGSVTQITFMGNAEDL